MKHLTKEQFQNLGFSIKLNKTGRTKGFCIAKSKCGASTKLGYSYNKKLSAFELEADLYNMNTNFIIVDEDNKALEHHELHTVMYAKFNNQRFWDFVKKRINKY